MNTISRIGPFKAFRLASVAAIAGLAALAAACAGGPDSPPGAVHILTAAGTVNPVMERYLNRGIDAAEDEEAAAVVIRLDTPGGLSSSMDDIVKRIISADIPAVVYVWT